MAQWKDVGLPAESGDLVKDYRAMRDAFVQLQERMDYLMSHIETGNMTDDTIKNITGPVIIRVANVEADLLTKLTINQEGIESLVSDSAETAAKLTNVEGNLADAAADILLLNVDVTENKAGISSLNSTVGAQGTSITNLGNTVSAQGTDIADLEGVVTGHTSQISQHADEIALVVVQTGGDKIINAAGIVAAINAAGSSVKISADNINIAGITTFLSKADYLKSGTTQINGGTINTDNLYVSKLYGLANNSAWAEIGNCYFKVTGYNSSGAILQLIKVERTDVTASDEDGSYTTRDTLYIGSVAALYSEAGTSAKRIYVPLNMTHNASVYMLGGNQIRFYDSSGNKCGAIRGSGTTIRMEANAGQMLHLLGGSEVYMSAEETNIDATSDVNIGAVSDVNLTAGDDVNITATDDVIVEAGDRLTLTAGGDIRLNYGGSYYYFNPSTGTFE